jgi:chemotaxis protein methyltransferase CheR
VADSLLELELRLLLEAIHARYHYDFRGYAPASLRRRVTHAVAGLGCRSVSHLQERVLHEPELFPQLLGYLTVQVSDLFRDAPYFRALRARACDWLRTFPSLKVWVAGCSTGEEVYSLAIVLREEGLLDRTLLYATDINPEALRKAEAGIYALDRMAGFSEAYLAAGGRGSLADYYTAGYGAAVFDRTLRANVVFADHSLVTDGVFAEVQMVSCRNVLIYFDRALQDRAIGLFAEALPRAGLLGLGGRESLRFTTHAGAFADFAPDVRLFQRR